MPFYIYLSVFTEVIAVLVGTYYLKQMDSKFFNLYAYACTGVLTEAISIVMEFCGMTNNMLLDHLYYPLEFLLLSLLYLRVFEGFVKRKWMVFLISGFMLFCIVNPLFLQKYSEHSQVRSFSSIIFILFSLLYFYRVMSEANIKKLSREPMIWINAAVLFYFSFSLAYNVLFTVILDYSREFLKLAVLSFSTANIIFYLLIAVGFWKAGTQKKVV